MPITVIPIRHLPLVENGETQGPTQNFAIPSGSGLAAVSRGQADTQRLQKETPKAQRGMFVKGVQSEKKILTLLLSKNFIQFDEI